MSGAAVRWLKGRSLAANALRAADNGDPDSAIALASEIVALAEGRPALAKSVLVGALASGVAIMKAEEPTGDQMDAASSNIQAAIDLIEHVDPDFAKQLLPNLFAARMAIDAITANHSRLTADLAALEDAWADLVTDRALMSAATAFSQAWTIWLGSLASAGWALLTQLRISDARRVLQLVLKISTSEGDVKITYMASVLLALTAMLLNDREAASVNSQRATSLAGARAQFRTPLPQETADLLVVTLGQVRSWIDEEAGELQRAAQELSDVRREIGDGTNIRRTAMLLATGLELRFILRTSDVNHARDFANAVGVADLYSGAAGAVLAGPLVRLANEEGSFQYAASIVARLEVDFAWQVPFSLIAEFLGDMAIACARNGEDHRALQCVLRAAEAMSVLGGGVLTPHERRVAIVARRRLLETCLFAVTLVSAGSASAHSAIAIMQAWREGTLRELVLSSSIPLSPVAQSLLVELRSSLRAVESSLGGFDIHELTSRIEELRRKLSAAVGAGYASVLMPRPVTRREVPVLLGSWTVTATVIDVDGRVRLVSAISEPSGRMWLRSTRLRAGTVKLLGVLARRFDPILSSMVSSFEELWQVARVELAIALGVDLMQKRADGERVLFDVDGQLRNIPIAALGSKGELLIKRREILHAPFVPPADSRPVQSMRDVPMVLMLASESARGEVENLRRLEALGVLHLTLVVDPAALRFALADETFDLLILSSHGEGVGMGYRFTAEEGEPLFVHDLLGLRIPARVIAASCFSGSDGEVDVTGLLATLHARGAQEVLSSLWAVPARETSMLVQGVLEQLLAKSSLGQALAYAQKRFIAENAGRRDIYWWAGLTVSSVVVGLSSDESVSRSGAFAL